MINLTTTLVSFFNTNNIGDRLISNTLKDKLSKYDDLILCDFLSQNDFSNEIKISEDESKDETKDESKGSLKINALSKASKLGFGSILSKISYDQAIKKNNFINEKYENSLNTTDQLIIGGGNMIFDVLPYSSWSGRFSYYVNKAVDKDIPIFAISIGIGPFQNRFQHELAVSTLKKCRYITFRDYKSLALFKELAPDYENAWVVPDPVFFMDKKKVSEPKETIAVNIINTNLYPNEISYSEVIKNYALLIDKLTTNFNKKVIIFNTETKDYQACIDVFKQVTNKANCETVNVTSIQTLLSIYEKSEILIGTRMHSLITAFSQRVPIIGLYWQQKVAAMFQLIEDESSLFQLFDFKNHIDDIINLVEMKMSNDQITYFNKIEQKLIELEKNNDEILKSIYG